ncbi:ABC transporter permease [Salinibacter sp. 10B]|uniref:ABC transporter permease n=1 Tax=Salinibacter sp. 10B TaxID=1923971 RepID=UPI000CF50958|nr:ABC transporter permease [Salinibacter sp. 10B]PQJ34374.1 ABC transporter permease [Salinibacter sp. 10B]
MSAIGKKLLRDLWGMRGQALAIAVVIVSGVAMFIAALGTMDALTRSQQSFYEEARFGEAFAALTRAPNGVERRLQRLEGVATVQTRVVADARLNVEAFDEPITGQLLSLPERGQPTLNQLVVRQGRLPRRGTETVVSEAFAEAHDLGAGDEVTAIINGRHRALTIVGVVLSPEYIYQIQPGGFFPTPERFGVLWMSRSTLGAAYDMEGAFNSVSFSFTAGAVPQDVLDRIDQVLAPYGGRDAYLREDQVSHRYLTEELKQLEQLVTVMPVTFLAVAAFLLNVVIGRLIRTQREVIATLKAFGYSDWDVGGHYVGMVLVIVAIGAVGGVALGTWMGQLLSQMYLEFYKFPELHYALGIDTVAISVGVTAAAALGGTLYAVWQAVSLRPAQAMQPEPPATYRETIVERLGLKDLFDQPTRMILRHLERRPIKALLSVLGIAASIAILMTSTFFADAVDFMIDVQFNRAQRQDLTVTFTSPTSDEALYELTSLRGVVEAEPFRSVPVRFQHEHRQYRTGIEGLASTPEIRRPLTDDLEPIDLAAEGVVLSNYIADVLEVTRGDTLTVEVLEGARSTRQIRVAGRTKQFVGVGAYMQIDALNRLVREGSALSGAYLALDPRYEEETISALTGRPRVASVQLQRRAIQSLLDTMGETVLTFTFVMALFAGAIAFGVIYNAARIALSERARELASLRILGFSQGEIGYVLLGELALLTLIAIPVGFVLGYGLCYGTAVGAQTELFRIPLVLTRRTYALSALVVLVAGGISGLVVWRRLGNLNLIDVLKTRE